MQLTKALMLLALALGIGRTAAAQPFYSSPVKIPGASNILVTGMNDSEELVMNYTDAAGTAHCLFIAGKTILQIADPNEVAKGPGKGTSCWGINTSGQIVGSYSADTFGNGFVYTGGVYTDIVFPGATAGTTSYGLNNVGNVVGSYADNGGQHGFVYTASTGTYETLDVPGAFATLAVAINDSGATTFEWVNPGGDFSGAVLQQGNYTILNVPGALQTKARGINARGVIVVNGEDTSGVWHGFLYKGGKYIQFDVANAANTYPFGLNDLGLIVGGFNPASAPSTETGFWGLVY